MNESVDTIKAETLPVVARASAIVVKTPEQYSEASDFLKAVKGAQKRVTDFFSPMKSKAHEAWKAITTTEAATLKPLQDAEAQVKRVLVAYQAEQEAIRQAEQRRLQAAADEAARKERERLEKEAAKLKTPELREARLEQAAAVIAPVVTVAAVTPVIAGQSVRKTWKARVVNQALVPREWLVVNEKALDAFAKATKGAVPVAGVEMYEETGLASSSK
jgi:hypothetical protein